MHLGRRGRLPSEESDESLEDDSDEDDSLDEESDDSSFAVCLLTVETSGGLRPTSGARF